MIETASRFYPSYKEKDVEHFMTEAEGRVEFYYMAAERDGQSV